MGNESAPSASLMVKPSRAMQFDNVHLLTGKKNLGVHKCLCLDRALFREQPQCRSHTLQDLPEFFPVLSSVWTSIVGATVMEVSIHWPNNAPIPDAF